MGKTSQLPGPSMISVGTNAAALMSRWRILGLCFRKKLVCTHTQSYIVLYHTYVLHVLQVLRRYMHVNGQNKIHKYICTVASAYAGVPLLFWCSQSRPEPICSKYLQTVRSWPQIDGCDHGTSVQQWIWWIWQVKIPWKTSKALTLLQTPMTAPQVLAQVTCMSRLQKQKRQLHPFCLSHRIPWWCGGNRLPAEVCARFKQSQNWFKGKSTESPQTPTRNIQQAFP